MKEKEDCRLGVKIVRILKKAPGPRESSSYTSAL
jgi:hypothetical protein